MPTRIGKLKVIIPIAALQEFEQKKDRARLRAKDMRGGRGYMEDRVNRPRTPRSASSSDLEGVLQSLHHAPYSALRDVENRPLTTTGGENAPPLSLTITRAQPDPFAPGSQVLLTIPVAWDVSEFMSPSTRKIAAEDFLLRRVHQELRNRPPLNFGAIEVLSVSQHVLERSALTIVAPAAAHQAAASIMLSCRVQIPGPRRMLDANLLHKLFFGTLVPAVVDGLQLRPRLPELTVHVDSVEDQEWLRQQLAPSGLVGFVANGSVLPRRAGDGETSMLSAGDEAAALVVPFVSPTDMEVSFMLPRQQRIISGMGIRPGLTLLVGGGFQGKSTLLRALEVGVYNHVPGDGREFVVIDPSAVKIRAEDRRSVQGVNISAFITRLHCSTTSFCTNDASGSTSQASNMIEAIELGSKVLLLDEDTCATNLMYRDAAMSQLIPQDSESITTLLQRLPQLLATGTSLIVVAGGSGQYFAHAMSVVAMEAFVPRNVTRRAKEIAEAAQQLSYVSREGTATELDFYNSSRHLDFTATFRQLQKLEVDCGSVGGGQGQQRKGGLRVRAHGVRGIAVGTTEIDLNCVEQVVEAGQVTSIGACLAWLIDNVPSVKAMPMSAAVVQMSQVLFRSRLRLSTPSLSAPQGFLSMPRQFEIGAALNRLRTLRAIPTVDTTPKR